MTPGGTTLTVKDTVAAYLQGQRGRDQHLRLTRCVLSSAIAEKTLGSLTEAALIAWRKGLPKTLKASTVRRISTDFRAALNAAAKAHRKDLPADFPAIVQHGLAVKEPTVAGERETQVLPDSDIRRLVDAAWAIDAEDGWGGDLARLILVLAATGARFSQIARMTVADVRGTNIRFQSCHQIAEDIRNAIRARFDEDVWEHVVKPLNDQLREHQKQALVAYLLVQQDLVDWGVTDADSLFEFFLIDVQMDGLHGNLPHQAGCKFARNNDPLRGDFASNSDPS